MIGDPSGVSEERNLLDPETLAKNLEGITVQLEKLLDFSPGPHQARLVNNYTWTSQVGLLDFLRDTGKYVTVNQMVARESVRGPHGHRQRASRTPSSPTSCCRRPTSAGSTSTSTARCRWAAPTSGATSSLASTSSESASVRTAYGLTWPLLLKADGTKFGKSAGRSGVARPGPHEPVPVPPVLRAGRRRRRRAPAPAVHAAARSRRSRSSWSPTARRPSSAGPSESWRRR